MAERRYSGHAALFASLTFAILSGAQASASDLAWQHYEDAQQAFDEHRFDVALTDWQDAAAERKDRFVQASSAIERALALPEAANAWDRVDLLVERLASKEFGAREFALIREAAAGSPRREMESLHLKTQSPDFANFTSAWLAIEELRGAAAINNSLKTLKTLALELQSYPEAEFGIGKVFNVEGELALAELQYRKALDAAASLEVPDDRLEIVMALAGVHKSKGDWKSYEDDLRLALADSVIFSPQDDFMRTAMERALDLEGFDTMVSLYPVHEPKIIGPASALGEFFLRNGRSQATISLALAADAMITQVMERLRINEPGSDYSSLSALADRIAARREVAEWCDAKGLWKYLYYLGESLLGDSRLQAGRRLLRELAGAKGGGAWGRAAAQALARPSGVKPAILP